MLVNDYMTRHPIMIPPEAMASEAQKVMSENKVRHLPVVGDGKRLRGLITRQRLALKPDTLGSLNVWEITRYLADMRVEQVMVPADQVHTITPQRTIERAAHTMATEKIGCLPVLDEDGIVIGIISEIDLLRGLQDMLGFPFEGVRATIRVPNQKGEFAKLTSALAKKGWGVMAIGCTPASRQEGYWDTVVKIPGVSLEEVREVLGQVPDQQIVDIRTMV
jgi:acetoin utilization protein AcuB